jgi:hypothetical protein
MLLLGSCAKSIGGTSCGTFGVRPSGGFSEKPFENTSTILIASQALEDLQDLFISLFLAHNSKINSKKY